MQIYDNKRNCLHKKRVQLPQDCFGTATWPPFIVLENQYGRRDVSLRSRRLEVTGTGKNRARVQSCAVYFQAAAYGDVMWKCSIILRRSLSRQIRYACAAGSRLLGLHFSVGHFRIKFSMIAITSLTGYEKRKWICWLTFFVCVL